MKMLKGRNRGFLVSGLILIVPAIIILVCCVISKNAVLTWISGMLLMFVLFSYMIGVTYIREIRNPGDGLKELQLRLLTTVVVAAILTTMSYGLDDLFSIRLNVLLSLITAVVMYTLVHVASLGIAAFISCIDFSTIKRELTKGE